MADTNDGSIHIDSTIDTSGVKKGAKEIQRETEKVVKKINETGKSTESVAPKLDTKELKESVNEAKSQYDRMQDLVTKFNDLTDNFVVNNPKAKKGSDLEAGLAQSEQALEEMKKTYAEIEKVADPTNPGDAAGLKAMGNSIKTYTTELNVARQKVERFRRAQEEAVEVPAPKLDEEGFEKGTNRMKSAIDSLRDRFKTVEESMRKGFNGIFSEAAKEGDLVKADLVKSSAEIAQGFAKLTRQEDIPEIYKQLEELQFLLNEMGRKTYKIGGLDVSGFDTDEYKEYVAELERFREMTEEGSRGSHNVMTGHIQASRQAVARFEGMAGTFGSKDIAQQGDLLDSLRTQVEEFEKSFGNGENSALDTMKEKLQELESEYAKVAQSAEEARQQEEQPPYTQGWDEAMEKIQSVPNLSWLVKSSAKDMLMTVAQTAGSVMAHVGSAINDPLGVLDRALGVVALKAKDALSGLMSLASGAIRGGLNMVASAAAKAAASLANMVKTSIISGFQKLRGAIGKVTSSLVEVGKKAVSSLGGASKKATQMNNGFAGGFKTILKYAFGIRSLYFLFRKLRAALSEGFSNVLKYDTELKATVDDFKTSLTTLKNAVGAAVAPLAQMVLPVLTRIIDAMTEGINKAGMLVAALTGAKQYTKASKEQAQAFQNEAKAAKEAQKTIAGFDDLTILQENENEDASAQQVNPGFETTPIENGIKGLADALKDMWEKADFTDLGRMLGERLMDALNSIPWDAIKEMCRKIGKSIATFLNGFFETPGLFDAIGRTIAEALNSVFEFLNAFVHALHWDSIGTAIKDGIMGFLKNIDWPLIQDTFKTLGEGLATLIANIVSDPTLPGLIGASIANVINTAFIFVRGFVTTLPWGEIGTFIVNGIIGFLQNINWPLIQETFMAFGAGLAEMIGKVFSDPTLPKLLGNSIANLINTVFLFAREFVTNLPWGDIGTFIHDAVLSLLTGINWKNIYDTTAKAGAGVGEALENALDDRQLWSEIFKTVSHAITALFMSLYNFVSTPDWASIGASIGNGLNDGVAEFPWTLVASTLVNAVNGAIDLLFNFLTTFDFTSFGEHIGNMISIAIHGIDWARFGALIATAISNLFNFFSGLIGSIDWAALGAAIVSMLAGFFGTFRWESVGQFISNCVIGLFSFLTGLFKAIDWVKLPGQIVDAIAQFLKGINWIKVLGTMFKFLGTAFISLVKLLIGVGGAINKAGVMIFKGLLQGIWSVVSGVGLWIKKNIFDKIVEGIKSVFGISASAPAKETEPLGVNVIEGFLGGILGPLKGIGGFLKDNVATPVIDGIKGLFGIGSGKPALEEPGEATTEGFKTGMSDGMQGIDSWLGTNITDPVKDGISEGLGTNGTPFTKEDGQLTVGGLIDGMEDEAAYLNPFIGENVTGPIADGMEDGLGISGGGSSLFNGYGQDTMGSFMAGMTDETGNLDSFIGDNVAGKITGGMEDSFGINSYGDSSVFSGYGEGMMKSMRSGMEMQQDMAKAQAEQIANSLLNAYTSVDWSAVGSYMLQGLYNGMIDGWDWIYTAVTDVANSLLNAAKYALGIASPSKEFYWISEMITAGLTNGLKDTGGKAVETVAALADEITEEAQTASPEIGIDTILDGSVNELDGVLTAFSDRVVAGFSQMIDALQAIAQDAGLAIPRTAAGAMAPYSTRISAAAKNATPDVETLMQIIAAQNSNRLTRDDIREILREAAQNYFNFDFYLGDEQVARSANRGNERLERRYRPVRS